LPSIGLPEVKLGLMPGFGGHSCVYALIVADNALEWMTRAVIAKQLKPLAEACNRRGSRALKN